MDEIKRAMLEDQEAERRLTETGYFKASGDLALCRCPFCGSEEVVYERYLHTVGYRWRVVCTSCMASIDPGYAQQRSMVQRMWNTRAPILSESGAYLFGLDGQSLDLALSALRSITREQMEKAWKGEWVDCSNGWMCSRCEYDNTYAKPFCPNCGAPMTDEAVDMVMERLEVLGYDKDD